jgi:hypothetical protein
MSKSLTRLNKISKTACCDQMHTALDIACECCAVIQYAKSEVIQLIERHHPISKMDLEEDKVSGEAPTNSPRKNELLSRSNTNVNFSINDFKMMGILGEGSYATVHLAEKDGNVYALKEISKAFILKVCCNI